MAIYEITPSNIRRIEETSFDQAGLKERGDLQRLLRAQIDVVAPDVLVIGEEFCDWEDSKRRIDLLAIDKDANLVVVELKRTEDGGHMELQAVRYAAMVSAMTFDKAVEVYAAHLAGPAVGSANGAIDAKASILEFLGWEEPDEDRFAQQVRIVLASAEFSKELTTAVMWLNDQGLDIRCVRLKPHRDEGRVLIDVQQVIPLPEASDYVVKLRDKEVRERTARKDQNTRDGHYARFWAGLLQRAKQKTDLHANVVPAANSWVARQVVPGIHLAYAFSRQAPRVDLYIFGTSRRTAKELFDLLHAQKEQVEQRFGGPMTWQRLDAKNDSRVRVDLPPASVRDEENWPALQEQMVDLMVRFEKALRPAVEALPQ